jgi:outer membrane protein
MDISVLFLACQRSFAALLLVLWIAAPAASAEERRDFFDTGRYVPAAPGARWQPPFALPQVTDLPGVPIPGERPLSLPELTEFALLNNPRTRQAWYAARAAAAGVGIEKAGDLPRISAAVTLQRSEAGGQSGNQIGWLTRYGPAVTLTYLLFDFGAGDSRLKAAEYQAVAASLSQNRVLQDVVFQVEQAYYRYLGFEQLVRSNELFLKSVGTALDATRRRREGGLATVADVYRAETQVAQAQLNLTRSHGELEKARGNLASSVGLPVNARVPVQALPAEPQIREISESLNNILTRAKSSRPDLIASEAQMRAARAQADAAAKSGLPSVSVTAGSGRTFFRHEDPVSFTQNNSVLLTLSIPVFTGFERKYTVRQAEARAAQAEAARDALSRQAEVEVWQSYYDVQTASGGVKTTAVQLRAAQQTAEATLARYQSGFGSLLDLITAQVDESNARVQRIQSYLDWFTAVARLNLAMGASDNTDYSVRTQ